VLIDVDNETDFVRHLLGAKGGSDRTTAGLKRRNVFAALLACGCHLGPERMAAATPGTTAHEIAEAADWMLTEDALKAAVIELVNYASRLPLSQIWGLGSTASSDGMRFHVPANILSADYSPLLADRGVTLVRHTLDNYHVDLHPEAAPLPGTLAAVAGAAKRAASAVAGLVTPASKTHLADYIGLLTESEDLLARAFDQTRETHANAPDMPSQCTLMAGWSREAAAALRPFVARYGERREGEPERLERALMVKRGEGAFDLLRDLQDLFLLANESLVSATILDQAAAALRDEELRAVLSQIRSHNERQREWLIGRCRFPPENAPSRRRACLRGASPGAGDGDHRRARAPSYAMP